MSVLHAQMLLGPGGWLASARVHLDGGLIAAVESGVPPAPGDERHALIIPAALNLHSHAFQRGMAGLAERRGAGEDTFWSWRDTMYRFAARMSPEQLQAVAAQAYVEMLEAGFARVGEFHYLHHDADGRPYADPAEMSTRVAAAAVETGLSLTLLPVFYAHSSFGGAPPTAGQSRFVLDPDGYARLLARCRTVLDGVPGAVLGMAPHSLRAVTPAALAHLLQEFPDLPVHIHVAEQAQEVRDCQAWCGARPVRWLLDHAPVDSRWCLVHATHLDAGERADLAASAATVGLCPVTEANLGDGLFPFAEFLAAGGRFGIGTDSNVCISLSGELALLEYGQRLMRRVRNVAAVDGRSTGASLYARALAGGAQALGVAPAEIAAGRPADLLSLSVQAPAMLCRTGDAWIDSWLFAATGGIVDCVWTRGRKQVEHGRHRLRERVRRDYLQALRSLCA